jgi:cytidine deaminase
VRIVESVIRSARTRVAFWRPLSYRRNRTPSNPNFRRQIRRTLPASARLCDSRPLVAQPSRARHFRKRGNAIEDITDALWQRLASEARTASAHAYCRYSTFAVGAAVLSRAGEIARGCNVENASYGLTICAERNAVFRAIADGADRIVALALYTPTPTPATPCGACRQVLAEFGDDALPIRCFCASAQVATLTLGSLLPHAFALTRRES